MFRKIAYTVLAFLLLTANTGFTVSKHYCGSYLVEISINSKAKPCCDDVGPYNCCHDETQHFQLIEDIVTPVSFENNRIIGHVFLFPLVLVYFLNTPGIGSIEFSNYKETPPSPNLLTKLSILQSYLL